MAARSTKAMAAMLRARAGKERAARGGWESELGFDEGGSGASSKRRGGRRMVATATCLGHSQGISATIPPVNRRKGTVARWAGLVGLVASWAEAH